MSVYYIFFCIVITFDGINNFELKYSPKYNHEIPDKIPFKINFPYLIFSHPYIFNDMINWNLEIVLGKKWETKGIEEIDTVMFMKSSKSCLNLLCVLWDFASFFKMGNL